MRKYLTADVVLRDTDVQGNDEATAKLIIGDAVGVTDANGRGTGATTAQTVTGDIRASGDGQGLVEIRNRATNAEGKKVVINGLIGASGRAVDSLLLADGETTITGNVFAKSIDVDSADGTTFNGFVVAPQNLKLSAKATFKGHVTTAKENSGVGFQFDGTNGEADFAGTGLQRVTGDITSSGSNHGKITVSNTSAAGVIFEGRLGAGESGKSLTSLTVAADAHVTLNKPVYLNGNLSVDKGSTITLGHGLSTRTGSGSDSSKNADAAFVTVGGYSFNNASAENKVTIVLPVTFKSGQQKLFSRAVASGDRDKLTLKEMFFVDYKLNDDGMSVTASEKSLTEVTSKLGVSQDQATVAGAALEAVRSDPVLADLLIKAASNLAEAKKLTEQLAPQTESVTAAVSSTGGQVAGVTSNRLSALRSGGLYAATGQTGFATGGPGLEKAFWLKPFGSRGQQSKTKSVAGFAMKSSGLAFGLDAPIGEQARVGTALAYSTTKVKGKGVGQNKTDVKSWQVSVYGDYSTDSYYVEGQLGLGRNGVTATSKVATMTRRSSYRTTQVMASVDGGVPLSVGGSAVVTPTAGLSYSRMGSADYTTTGARGWNQKISVTALDSVVGSLGAKVHARLKQQTGTLVPTARVGMSYDFAGDRAVVSGKFTGGGNAFKVKGAKVKKLSGTAGVGLTYDAPRWSVGADYDLNARSGYKSHTAQLNAKIKF